MTMFVYRLVVAAAATVSAVLLPAQLVLPSLSHGQFALFHWLVTLLYAADFAINLRASRSAAPGPGSVAGLGFRSATRGWLLADLLAALPFHAVAGIPALALFRLLKLPRVAQLMGEWRQRHAQHWNLIRLCYFVYWLGLSVHGLACGWIALHFVFSQDRGYVGYLPALYWCVQTLTTVGYGDVAPSNDAERIYAMVVMLIGVGVYGTVVGNVASLLANIDPARAHYLENLERLNVFMTYRDIPAGLQRRIRDYYTYLWKKRLGYDETTVLSGLPPGLLMEVSLFLKRDVLERVPFFKGASTELIGELALELRPVVFTPGDYICREGDQGEEMYFISRGRVQILSRDGSLLATLGDGDFFGEIALFMKVARTAGARAVDYCDVYALNKTPFERVLHRHPDFAAHIEAMIKERQERGR